MIQQSGDVSTRPRHLYNVTKQSTNRHGFLNNIDCTNGPESLLTTDSQPVRNVEPLILSKRYSSP